METHFKQITERDIEVVAPFFDLRPNWTCDSDFLNTFIWKDYYKCSYYIEEDGLALQWCLEKDGNLFSALPLCRPENLREAFDRAVRYFNEELGLKYQVYLADREALDILQLDPERFEVTEMPDAADYLYDAEALRTLPGKKYHKKKNHINAFLRDYDGRWDYRKLCCSDREEILALLDAWEEAREDRDESLKGEYQGISQVMENCSLLNVEMAGIFVDGALQAFTIGSYIPEKEMAIIHIEKANAAIRGLYPLINQQFLVNAFPMAKYANREDDVGDPGLRKAKLSYHPIDMVRKYRILQR